MQIPITPDLFLTHLRPSDEEACTRHLLDPEISQLTTGIPFPFGPEEFSGTLARAEEMEYGHPCYLAVRRADGWLMGGVTFSGFFLGTAAEIGYWIGREHWNRGIMTQAVRAACRHAFEELGLAVIFASVFLENVASQRVLEKCGFGCEGPVLLKKDGREIDGMMYVLTGDSEEPPF